MLGSLDYSLWVTGFLLEVYVVVCCLLRKDLLRYFSLNLYMLMVALTSVAQFLIYRKFGFLSVEYRFFYHYTDSLLTVLLYFAVMQFYQEVFREMNVSRYIRSGAILLLGATALFSYLVVRQHLGVDQNADHMTSRVVVELGQNLYFVGVVLTYLLWGAVLKLHETRARLIQLVLALGIFFSADAAAYSLRNLFPGLEVAFLKWIPPLASIWLPLAWSYTFTIIPEEARLATARLVARTR